MKKIFTVLGIGLLSFNSQAQTAMDFEETSADYVDIGIGMNPVFTGTNTITTEAWVNLESAGTFRTIAGNYNTNNLMQFLLRIDNGKATFWVHNGTAYTNVTGTSTIPVGTWTHIAGSWDGTNMRVYVNGVLENTVSYSGAFPSVSNSLRIGNSINGSEYMDGLIDDVRIWNVARTDAEISSNMNNCLTGSEFGLVALYNFETGSGSTVVDITGHGNNGTIVNSPIWSAGLGCTTCTVIDQTVNTADFTAICSVDTIIEIASSEVGVNYFLRDNSNDSIIDGPIAGTGSALQFNPGNVNTTSTYNVNATSTSYGVSFDGVDDFISANNLLTISNNFTYEVWVNPTSTIVLNTEAISGNTGTIGQKYVVYPQHGGVAYGSSNDAGVGVSVGTNGVSVYEHSNSYLPALLVYPTTITGWTHIAVVCTNKQYTLYVNGVLVKTGQTSLKANVHPNIGESVSSINSGIGGGDYGYFQGGMDDFRLWDYSRTPAEIQNSMNICLTGNESGLIANYDFNDANGYVATDNSVNGLDATLLNGPMWATGSPNVYCSSCDLQLTTTPTITINPIADQTVAATSTDLCLTNTGTTITTASSEVGLSYYLRDNANDTLIDGPLAGTGSGLTFNTGSLPNTTTYNVFAKKEGEVLDFDGVDDFISANNLLTISNNFTYEVWVNPTSTIVLNSEATSGITGSTGQKYVVYPQHGSDAYGSTNDAGVGVSVGTNGVSVYEHTGGYLPALLVYPTTITDWTHIAVVCTNKQYTLYINGVLVKTGQTSPKANVHPNIGESVTPQNSGIGGGDYGYFQGSMDDFRLWDYSRTPAEIQSSMINCINGSETGLVAAYDFEDGPGSTIASDKSTNNYNSTLTNMDVATDWMAGLTTCNCTSVMTITPTVTVQDIVAPVADVTTLSDVTAECSVTSLTDPTATDNCSATVTVTNDATLPISTQGTTVVTWTYDDGNGNTSTQTQNVVITDVTAPVADVATLSDVTAECSVTSLTAPTATDNCSATVTVTNDATLPITTQGTTIVTWTYDDGNGNTSTQTQNVVITDVTAPVADVAALSDITAECSVSSLTDPTATDNCSATVTVTNDATLPITTQGTTVVTWTYDDGNGNTSTQTQNVVITDVTAPVADVATLSDVTATCEVTSLTDPTATDNCSATVTVTNDATLPITTQGTTVVTWTYDDGNGNTSTQTQNVVITAPVIDVTSTTVGLTISANNTSATAYQWIDCNNSNAPISGETTASYTATVNGDYAVIVFDGNCSDTSLCVNIADVGINETGELAELVEIYPNPNNGEFYLNTTADHLTLTVYSVDGKIIVNNLKVTQATQLISLGAIESGVYFVKVMDETNQKTIRLVIE